ncbi:hypothetical protein AWENTII_002157 [Aspergillus wentii]
MLAQTIQTPPDTVGVDAIQDDRDEGSERRSTDQTQTGRAQPDPCSLSYIIEMVYRPEGGSAEPLKVHYPIPASIADRPAPSHQPELVSWQDALTLPERHVADKLVHAFFDIIHPAYPVFDRRNFTELYLQSQVSPLVLQTIFLLGFTVGSDTLVHEAGYRDRETARKTHYLRAKTLYDADYETNATIVAAVLFLLGFWWAGPEDQKDSCFWIGCATTVAQSVGMHRSYVHITLYNESTSQVLAEANLVTRDRHTSAAFGRPFRIRDEDCDVEPLTVDDFNFDNDYDQTLIPVQKDFHTSYVIEMSKLARILGDILVGEFSPRRPVLERFDTAALAGQLTQWESQLPSNLRRAPLDESLGAPFWASMLHFSYHYCQILLFRPKVIQNLSSAEAERDVRARKAADLITRIAEDLLAGDLIRFGQIHLVPALFGALSIHTIVICRNDHIRRQLAENKSRQCVLALSELAKSWPVKIWIAKAFVNLMRRLTGQGSAGGSIVNVSSSITTDHNSVPSSGHWGLLGLQYTTGSGNIATQINDRDQTAHNSLGASIQHTNLNACQPRSLHPSDYLLPATDQLLSDSFWAGSLDNAIDLDLLLHNGLGSILSTPYEGLNAVDNPNPQNL